jgi:hypothetical protein
MTILSNRKNKSSLLWVMKSLQKTCLFSFQGKILQNPFQLINRVQYSSLGAWTNINKQAKTWAQFSTLDMGMCVQHALLT